MAEAKIEITLSNGAKAGETLKELVKQANTLNKELKDLKPGTEQFIKKAADLKIVEGELGKIKTQIKGTTEASNGLKSAFTGVLANIPGFSALSGMLSQAKGGVGGLTSSFGLLKGAIAATGIGALVLIIVSLVSWFKKVNTGADLMEDALVSVRATIDVLIDRLGKFISGLVKFVSGDFKAGIDEMGDSLKGVGDEILRDVKAAQDLAAAMRDLEDAEIDYKIKAAETENQIKALMLQARNRTLSEKERIALLDQALALEKDLNKELLNNSEEGLRIANGLAAERLNISKEVGESELAFGKRIVEEFKKDGQVQADDLRDKVVDMLVTLEDAGGKSIALQEKIQNQRDALSEKEEAEREKAAAAELKRIEEEKKAQEKALAEKQKAQEEYYNNLRIIEDAHIQVMEESREKDLLLLKTSLQRQIEAIDMNSPLYAERVAAAQELARKQRNDINEKWDEAESQKKFDALELELETEQNALNERLLAGQLTEEEFTLQSGQKAIDFQKSKLDLLKAKHGEESLEYQRANSEYIALQQAQSDAAVEIKKQEMADQKAAMMGALGTFGSFFGQIAGIQKQGTARWKAFATASAIMSTIQGAINAFTSTAAIPVVGGVLAPIAAAFALAAGYANVKKIQATKVDAPVQAARGMVLRGPSHAEGGIPVEAEGDEIIMTKGVYRNPRLRAMASDINVAAGGIRFAALGGPVSPFQNQSSVPSTQAASTIPTDNSRMESLMSVMAENNAILKQWPTKLKVINVVTDTEDGIKTVNQIRDDADV